MDVDAGVDVGDHYRGADGATYRVVGTGEAVTLLRVTDGEGRRVSSGDLRRVAAAELEDGFEPAADPDAGFTPVRTTLNVLSGLYWDVRKFL